VSSRVEFLATTAIEKASRDAAPLVEWLTYATS
jgi:hypothetical protein